MDVDDPSSSTLDFFLTWKVDALRSYLEKRGLSRDGKKNELAALCFAATKMEVPIVPTLDNAVKENKRQYERILTLDDTVLPDPFSLCKGWFDEKEGVKLWPAVTISEISIYFMARNDPMSSKYLNEYKVGKAYAYFTSGWLKEVFYHPINSLSPYCLLRAACTPSMKVADVDHSVWCCIKKMEGTIMRAYCSCTAELGQTCNHVAGLVFRVEHAARMGISNPSCTSLPCTWTIPTEKVNYGPREISEMLVKKIPVWKSRLLCIMLKSISDKRPLVSAAKRKFQPLADSDAVDKHRKRDHLLSLGPALKDALPNACLFKGLQVQSQRREQVIPDQNKGDQNDTLSGQSKSREQVTQNLQRKGDRKLLKKISLLDIAKESQDVEEFIERIPKYTTEEIQQISSLTKDQSQSDLWKAARRGRITASRFYAVHTKVASLKKKPTTDTKSLMRQLLAKSSLSDDISTCPKALRHGITMEPLAKEQYIKETRTKHLGFQSSECGLFIHPEVPYIGATPDMLVSCNCCGDGLLEVKCPMLAPCKSCLPSLCRCEHSLRYLCIKNNATNPEAKYCILCTGTGSNGHYW